MSDRRIDPYTGDYSSAPKGQFEQCDVLENKITMSNTIPRGSWEGDLEMGHRFAELERAGDTDENLIRLRDFALDAVQWLLDSGELERVEVTTGRFEPGTFWFEALYYPPGRNAIKPGRKLVPVGAN